MDNHKPKPSNILLGITGSVAAVKGPKLAVRLVKDFDCKVKILLTRGGTNFWEKAKEYDETYWNKLQSLIEDTDNSQIVIHSPDDEWNGWNRLGDPVLHIDLRDWADIMIVAPLSAHTLAKMAQGLSDDTLSCVLRAWDFGHHESRPAKPIILAPAMNTAMWQHPLTQEQLKKICAFASSPSKSVRVVDPAKKKLACGEIGQGALADVEEIMEVVRESLVIHGGWRT